MGGGTIFGGNHDYYPRFEDPFGEPFWEATTITIRDLRIHLGNHFGRQPRLLSAIWNPYGEPFWEATTTTIRDLRIHVAPTPTIRDLDLPGPSQEPPSGRLGLHFGIHLGIHFESMLDTILEPLFGANPIW